MNRTAFSKLKSQELFVKIVGFLTFHLGMKVVLMIKEMTEDQITLKVIKSLKRGKETRFSTNIRGTSSIRYFRDLYKFT